MTIASRLNPLLLTVVVATGTGATIAQFGYFAGFFVVICTAVLPLALRLPIDWWPAVHLLVMVVLPARALPLPGNSGGVGSVSPSLAVVAAWALVSVKSRHQSLRWASMPVVSTLAVLAVAWLAVSTVYSGSIPTSILWVANFIILIVMPLFLLRRVGVEHLIRIWRVSGAALGAYSLLEAFVLRSNPIWEWSQVGLTSGRAYASMSHPLVAGSFFVGSTLLALGTWMRVKSLGAAVGVMLSAGGIIAVGSRGALVGLVCGVAVLVVPALLRRNGAVPLRPVTGLAIVLGLIAVGGLGLAQRVAGGDAEGSNSVRARSAETGLYIAGKTGLTGFGPGTAYNVKTETAGAGTDEERSIENAWIELFVGTGATGVVLIGALFVACIAAGWSRNRFAETAATVGTLVTFTFYNALEGGRPNTMVELGLLLGACLSAPRAAEQSHLQSQPAKTIQHFRRR